MVRPWLAVLLVLELSLALPGAAAVLEVAGRTGGAEPVAAIAPPTGLDQAKVALGRKLFHDPRLSGSGRLACSSCHDLAHGGDDGRALGPGSNGRPLDFNTPTVFNATLNFRFNWRGNFRQLEAQNEAALLDPAIMASSWPTLLSRFANDPDYPRRFEAIYGGEPGREEVLDALASFQRSLVTPGARFDRFLEGEEGALTARERRGYELFKAYGCSACHQGRNVGGNLFQRFGVFQRPRAERGSDREADLGRFTITGREFDRRVFRVPSLRNVAATAPYLHDGRARTLPEAVAIMGRSQLGIELPEQDIALIVAFLNSLTGRYDGRPVAGDTELRP